MKPKFKHINYDPSFICWANGNKLICPNVIATIQIREKNKKELKKEKEDYQHAELIYNEFINVGTKFKPSPAKGLRTTEVIARITRINLKTQTVSWTQDNFTDQQKKQGYKPASGKWNICGMINMFKSGSIELSLET